MDIAILKLSLTVLNMLISAAVWLFVWQDRKSRVTRDSIKSLEQSVHERFESKCLRLSKLEAELNSLPRSIEILRIHERIDDSIKSNQETQLLIGELIGQIKQMNVERSRG
ncbi:MAG: hypothetical protein DRQ62_10790 [Gammaproteobacteria bacterium]|nr:MAG: hypothetical protein DRQ62_10790 [Gammaproteobacteria bacterium]